MAISYHEIEFPLAALSSETVEEALLEIGASSITFTDRGDEPVLEPKPGEVRLWSDTLVRGLFESSSSPDVHLRRLAALLGPGTAASARVRAVEDQDWERVWLADWKPMRFGRRLWICPTFADAPADPEAVVVRLDPGLAFGTGTHPTTALCLQALDSLPLEGKRMIDYGCGSGVLGLAALKLGASGVIAVDLDPQALTATRDNAARNGVAGRIEVRGLDESGSPGPLAPAHCVAANILEGPLLELAPVLTAACLPGADLILSGVLRTQAYAVRGAYAASFPSLALIEREDWCCLHGRKAA